jgi:AcrR family transcriptional regulator
MKGTKWEIFCCAIYLFAEHDYTSVSTRQIAHEIGIRASALYNHFASKDDILETMYEFYRAYGLTQAGKVEDWLALAETSEPRGLLISMHQYYPADIQVIMDRLVLIAHKMMRYDERADQLISWQLLTITRTYFVPVLERLVELGRIEPLDIDAMLELLNNFYYGSALRMYSSHPVDPEMWARAWRMIFELVTPTGR